MLQIGELYQGRYTLTAELPSLAFAKTYLATDKSLDRQVEVTVLEPRFAGNTEFASKFVASARSALELAHPAIARTYDVGQDPTTATLFVIAEHIPGTSLGAFINSAQPDLARSVTLMESVFSALEYAHQRGVNHLGLTNASIIVSPQGRAKISGFGMASLAATTAPTADALAVSLRTSAYLAPEQILSQPTSAATDIYAAGLLLRECLEGRPLFDSATRGDALRARMASEAGSQVSNPTWPRDISALVMAAGATIPDARPTARTAVDVLVHAVTPTGLDATEALLPPTEAFVPIVTPAPVADANQLAPGVDPELAKIFPASSLSTREFTANEFTAGRTRNALISSVVVSLATVLILATAILVVVRFLPSNFLPSTSRTVPQVVGLSYDQALAAVNDAGLVLSRTDTPSTTIQTDHVIASDPVAGTKLEVGSTVAVQVSVGNATIAVPDLTGVEQTAAQKLLIKAGLTVGVVTPVPSAAAPKGSVVATLPGAGIQVSAGTAINLSISNGQVTIPSLVGKPLTEATGILEAPAIGITPSITSDSSCATTTPTSVKRQSPSPGTVPSNTKVTLVYCSGH